MTIRFSHSLLILLHLFFLIFSGVSFGSEETVRSSETKKAEKPINQRATEYFTILAPPVEPIAVTDDWMQNVYLSISDSVYQSAFWFDGFFTNDDNDRQNPKTSARIRLAWEPERRSLNEFDARFRIKVKLPHFKNKFDLILSDDNDDELSQLPLEKPTVGQQPRSEQFAAALRFVHFNDAQEYNDTRVGISGGDVFMKTRYIKRYAWQNVHGLKFEPSLFYFIGDGLGARLLMEYNYQLNNKEQLRVDYSIRGSASFSGIRWKHGVYHLKQLEHNKATALGLIAEGERNGANRFFIDKYTLNYRFRFNAIKKWLFFDIEPFVEWRKDEGYGANPGLALRVEGYFSKG